ncbi:hypothetical protein CERSUDRAFT_116621 [Gelatoporia subvermispora B]|uniref:Casein kinase substrate phosphoprotein PP28 domain-containing protein n=1 Tax=Ceriporiopsis subvermispora (strain B) TaxID=914234 RepID=M2R9M1_CERS8|nr:hypothetical protein CERSUDRAFT_116621 [Gelatoporia subvermispora B]
MARGGYKLKRGGGRSRSKHLVLDENGTAVSQDRWATRGKKDAEDSESGSDEEESEEEESEEEPAAGASAAGQPELTRTERRELKKKKAQAKQAALKEEDEDEEEGDDPLLANPNITVGKKMNIADLGAPRELTRREREEKEKKDAKERYWKLHEQGKTDEAKADLARLAKIRAEREAAQARRKAETEAKAAEVEAKRKEQASRKRV